MRVIRTSRHIFVLELVLVLGARQAASTVTRVHQSPILDQRQTPAIEFEDEDEFEDDGSR